MDEFESVSFPPPLRNCPYLEDIQTPAVPSSLPLSQSELATYFDHDGRLIDEHNLRKAIFKGGIDKSIRKQVWPFLFELYPFNSTKIERDAIEVENRLKYMALKTRWQDAFKSEKFNTKDVDIIKPDYLSKVQDGMCDNKDIELFLSTIPKQQVQFLKLQAEVFSGRLGPVDMKALFPYIIIIDKDVPRTDRDLEYFSDDYNPHLQLLRDILITYATLNPSLGYTQGMSDIVSRFLIVLDDEVEAFWCFNCYMKYFQNDFLEDGLTNKLTHVCQLLMELDPDLYQYLQLLDVADLSFCHRWMLLGFKREFQLEDSLRCFEIISCHHLELSSLEAQLTREGQKRKDFESQGGKHQILDPHLNLDFTFDVFLCATILISKRDILFDSKSPVDAFQLLSSLYMQMDLNQLLQQSEKVFYKYCRTSINDCFHYVDIDDSAMAANNSDI